MYSGFHPDFYWEDSAKAILGEAKKIQQPETQVTSVVEDVAPTESILKKESISIDPIQKELQDLKEQLQAQSDLIAKLTLAKDKAV